LELVEKDHLRFEHGIQQDDIFPGNGDFFNGRFGFLPEKSTPAFIHIFVDSFHYLLDFLHHLVKDLVKKSIAASHFHGAPRLDFSFFAVKNLFDHPM